MASTTESQELWESNIQGNKLYAAVGTRDVLILVSSESGGADIVARKKGELTQQDKDRLTSQGIPQHCWDDDVMIMKERYRKGRDNIKSLHTEEDASRQQALDKITTLFNSTSQQGVIVHYIGPGRRGTGDWCFSDGFISFTDIANLYMEHFTGKTLYVISDCSYSSQWVESCKEFLDTKGVQPCGHSARKTGIKMKVHCSCQPDQIANSLIFSAEGLHNDKNTGVWYMRFNTTIAPDQTTRSEDFTKITCHNFTFQEKTKRGEINIIKGVDRNRPAWYYIQLKDDPETAQLFKEEVQGDNKKPEVTLTDYGVILKSGYGQEPLQEVKEWAERILNGLEDLPHH